MISVVSLRSALCVAVVVAAVAALWAEIPARRPTKPPRCPPPPDAMLKYLTRQLNEAGGDRAIQAEIHKELGSLYYSWGELWPALDHYKKAREKWRALGESTRRAKTDRYIAQFYSELARPDDAVSAAQDAVDVLERVEDPDVVYTQRTQGIAYTSLEQWEEAFAAFKKGRGLCWKTDDPDCQAFFDAVIGFAQFKRGQTDQAIQTLTDALARPHEFKDERARAYLLASLAEVLGRGKKDWNGALPLLEEELEILLRLDDPYALPAVRYGLGLAQHNTGDLIGAAESFRLSLEGLERLRSRAGSGGLQSSLMAGRHDYFFVYSDLLVELDQKQPGQGYAAKAFEVAEQGRARGLFDQLQESRVEIQQRTDPHLLDLERRMAEIDAAQRAAHSQERTPELAEELGRLETDYEEFEAEIRDEYPQYAELARPQPLSAGQVQQLLDQDTLMLAYLLGEDRSLLFVVSREGVKAHRLPARKELETKIRTAYGLLKKGGSEANCTYLNGLLQGLRELLLGQVEKDLGQKRLVILADGALHLLPFGALPDPAAQRQDGDGCLVSPLVLDHEIAYLPSASVLAALRREEGGRQLPPKWVAALGGCVYEADDPRFPPSVRAGGEAAAGALQADAASSGGEVGCDGLDRLPHTSEEVQAILARVPSGLYFEALDFEANRATATSPELAQYRVFHFAGHSRIDEETPQLSGLVFSCFDEQGRPREAHLRLPAIYGLRLPVDLVVLSACATALGRDVRGEGLIGLTRGFMYAGAPRVIVSLWKVEDRATAHLMDLFYEGLFEQELTAAEALRRAQEQMSRHEKWNAPYYWAGFVLQGDWRQRPFRQPVSTNSRSAVSSDVDPLPEED